MKIDKIYVISLEATNPQKQKEIVSKLDSLLENHGNVGYEIVQGFDGRNGNVPGFCTPYDAWKLEGSDHSWWNRPLLGGELGCTISHVSCWQKIAEGNEHEQNVLILEDDFKPLGAIDNIVAPTVDWDIALLGRYVFDSNSEQSVDAVWVKPNRSYNAHAYVIKKHTAIKYLKEYNLLDNVIPVDEFMCATWYQHPREDIAKLYPPKIQALSLKNELITQKRNPKDSNIEHSAPLTDDTYFEILDTSNWELWKEKYVNKTLASGEYDLMVDDLGDNIYEFPLFTPKFCKEVVALAETLDNWTENRHEYYPTNDVLLQDIRLQDIYHRVLKEVVYPLCVHLWHLEGPKWLDMYSENFMIRYTTQKQSHLSLHHDHSDISMVVKLNDEFEGGGTWFPRYGTLSNPSKIGTASLHPGRVTHRHGARPITAGKRYITVSFMRQDK